MRDVVFFFSPLLPASASSPYLAPHLLSTILRKQQFNVENRDLNRAFIEAICVPEKLTQIRWEACQLLKTELPDDKRVKANSAIRHLDFLLEQFKNQTPIRFNQKVLLGNFLYDLFAAQVKTVTDYLAHGLDTIAPIRETFYDLIDQTEVEGKTICISCAFGDQLPFSLELARYIRSKKKNTKILLGGAQVSLLPSELIEEIKSLQLFNVLFSGYAEDKIAEVIQNAPDTYFTEVTYGSTATSQMLDALPYTEFDEIEKYAMPSIPVMVNKGCYWGKCSFCDYILMGDLGGFRYIGRSVEIVYDEIKKIREKHPHASVRLISDAVPPKFYKELCILANKENFALRTSSYMINNKNLTEDFFKEASQARIGTIVFGTESTNDRILSLMQKQGRREDILRNLAHANQYNVPIKVNLIPNYPTSTYEEALQTYKDIWLYRESIMSLAVFKFYLSANTQMDQSPEDYDLEINSDVPYQKSFHNGYHSRDFRKKKGMTAEEEKKVYGMFYRLSFEISLNRFKAYFRSQLAKHRLEQLRLKNNSMFYNESKKLTYYSPDGGFIHPIPDADADILHNLRNKSLTVPELCQKLGPHAIDWFEHYYSLDLFEFAS